MKLLIKNGRVIDAAGNLDKIMDLLVEDGRILRIDKGISAACGRVIEAAGKIVMPGLIDMHVHLREPGREDKETIRSGIGAALKGGVTTVLAMPNTEPAIDCVENARLLKDIIRKEAGANVFIAAAITKGRLGRELTDIEALKKQGVKVITDDGVSVDDDELMLAAFTEAKKQGILVMCHSEDKSLSSRGVVNLGFTSTRLGLRGISNESEYRRVARDIALAKKAKARVHISHVSCKETVEIIAEAKRKGVDVTAETAPHYFSLTEESMLEFDTNMKMNPPLRSKQDVLSIRQALADGTIDVIASDHAPHTENEKHIEFERAAFGVIGLETELAAAVTELVSTGLLDWTGLVRRMALNPAIILGIDKGELRVGCDADIIVLSPEKEWVVRKDNFVSKSKNSCFVGKTLKGVVDYTIRGGEIVYSNKSL